MLAALSWAAGNLVVKRAGEVDMIAFLVWSSLFSLPPLFAMSLVFEGPMLIVASLKSASFSAWAIVVWQALGNTLIGYGLWNVLLLRYPASKVAPWALMVPVFGIAAASLILHEPMPWWKWFASVLILLGLVINVAASRSQSIKR